MERYETSIQTRDLSGTLANIVIRLGALAILVVWCFQILQPFLLPAIWGIIISVAIYPLYRSLTLTPLMRGRSALAATLVSTVLLALLLVPTAMLTKLLVQNTASLANTVRQQQFVIPPPPDTVQDWPLIGEPISRLWSLAATNLAEALKLLEPQLKIVGIWLLEAAASAGMGLLLFAAAFVVAGILLRYSEAGHKFARDLSNRLAGERGDEFANLAGATIRSVSQGVLGVAIIQSLLAGLGFMAVGLPGAGIWAFLCLITATIQIGVAPIAIPAVIYVFATSDTVTAVVFLVWSVVLLLLDNVLKPLLLGRGLDVPTVVIFLGAIGGMMMSGIIGLFVGAIVLALGYKLLQAWLAPEAVAPGDPDS